MATYKRQRYLLMATDPVHIGTGGYRLGRVDNSIVREAGTRMPKVPGTSLHGAARAYAAKLCGTPEAAGQNHDRVDNPKEHPVCYTFGYIKKEKSNDEEKTTAYSGVVNVFDAHVLLFPVRSMDGPLWVSTVSRLCEAGFSIEGIPENWEKETGLLSWERQEPLNLGWLMINVKSKITVSAPAKWREEDRWKAVCDRLVLLHETLFSQVVNSNLEVRTSVAINPDRGAAEDKALFTYEALPRATFLTAEVVSDDYREGESGRPFPYDLPGNQNPGISWEGPLDVVKAGLKMIEWLGVGGMGTRGFGRMAIVSDPLEQEYGQEVWQ